MAAKNGKVVDGKKMGDYTLNELAQIKQDMAEKGIEIDFAFRNIYCKSPLIRVETGGCTGDIFMPFDAVFDIEKVMINGVNQSVKTHRKWLAESQELLKHILKMFPPELPAAECSRIGEQTPSPRQLGSA